MINDLTSYNCCPLLDKGTVSIIVKSNGHSHMKKFILGIIIGVALIVVFIYLGGGNALKIVGKKTIEIGERVEVYEKAFKDVAQGLLEKEKRK
jgi:hypothetical protein